MSETFEAKQDWPDVPKLVVTEAMDDHDSADEIDEEEAALRQEIDKNVAELEHLAEESIRAKSVADAEEEIGDYEERRKNGTLPEGVRDEQDFQEYAEEKRARARESATDSLLEARQRVLDAYDKDEENCHTA